MEILKLILSPIDGKKFRIIVDKYGQINSELPFSDGQEDPKLFTVLYALNTLNPNYSPSNADDIDWMVEKGLLYNDKQSFHPKMRENIGQELYKALFLDRVRDALYEALAKANSNPGRERLHIQIQYDANTLEKSRLPLYPWHLVHNGQDFLAQNRATFSYLIAHQNSLQKRKRRVGQIKILLISSTSAEKDEERLRSKELKIREGLKKAEEEERAYLLPWYQPTIEKPTFNVLSAYLTNHKNNKDKIPDIIHFDGHGFFKRRCNNPYCPKEGTNEVFYSINTQRCSFCNALLTEPQGFLLFESDEGKPDYISAERFAELVGRSKAALVVITACNSAHVDESDSVFNGIAQRLLREVPAVVATPFKISQESLTNFVEQFYRALGAKESLLEAVKQASSNMRYQEYEWYRPVIFLRHQGNEDGYLFQFVSSKVKKNSLEAVQSPIVSVIEEPKTKHEQLPQEWGWEEAPNVPIFFGRTKEIDTLSQWIIDDHCKLVGILGLGGMGKTSLAVKLVEKIKNKFEYVIWRSLKDAPKLKDILADLIKFLTNYQNTDVNQDVNSDISKLIGYFNQYRCLLVLDNLEGIMRAGVRAGSYQDGYEGYGELLRRIGDGRHQSCLIVTSRERPQEIVLPQERQIQSVRSLQLEGLEELYGREIFTRKGLFFGSDEQYKLVIENYAGNPLALNIAASAILETLDGNISEFINRYLNKNNVNFSEINDVLKRQFNRLSDSEQEIMYWLAINREPQKDSDLKEDIISSFTQTEILEVLSSLQRRSLIERNAKGFTLQPGVMEYVIDRLINVVSKEIETGKIALFNRHALIKAHTKDYIREIQIRLILDPLLNKVIENFSGNKSRIDNQLMLILSNLQNQEIKALGYIGGNIINLLDKLKINLSSRDFSNIIICQADFCNFENLKDIVLNKSTLSQSIFPEQFGHVFAVAFSPTGEFMAFGDGNGKVHLYQMDSYRYRKIHTFRHEKARVWSIAFHPKENILASGGDDCTVRLWKFDIESIHNQLNLKGHTGAVRSVAFNSEGTRLASGDTTGTVKIWQMQDSFINFHFIHSLDGHQAIVWSVSFHPKQAILASGSDDKTIKLWNTDTFTCIQTLQEPQMGLVRSVAFSLADENNESVLASAGQDRKIRIWQNIQGTDCVKLSGELSGHRDWIWSIAFSTTNRELLASASSDKTIRLWDINTQEYKVIDNDKHAIRSIAFNPDGRMLVTGSYSNTVKLLDVQEQKCLKTLKGLDDDILSIAFHPSSNLLASSGDKIVRLWNISKIINGHFQPINLDDEYKLACKHEDYIWSVAFHPTGNFLATGSDDGKIGLWNVREKQHIDSIKVDARRIRSVAFSPNGKKLACVRSDKGTARGEYNIWVWNFLESNRKSRYELKYKLPLVHKDWLWSLAISHDNQILASAGEDKIICLWDLSTGTHITNIEQHKAMIYSVAFSSGERILASGSGDRTIMLWNIADPHNPVHLRTLEGEDGHTDWVWSVAFRPITDQLPQKILASGSADCTVKLWNLDTGRCIQTLEANEGYPNVVRCVTFSLDGATLASAGDDESIQIWRWNGHQYEYLTQLKTEGPYEGMQIREVEGLSDAQKETLRNFGAIT
jgi:WD40 repeat protein